MNQPTELIKGDPALEIANTQAKWAQYVVAIGASRADKQEYTNLANQMLDELYDFSDGGFILFKPTLAAEKPVRTTRAQTLSYFIDGKVHEDSGFALTPWVRVTFEPSFHYTVLEDGSLLVMGRCSFFRADQTSETADYTFGYRQTEEGGLRIYLHHSSLAMGTSVHDRLLTFRKGKSFRVVLPGEEQYFFARVVSNTRFGRMPAGIAYCQQPGDISDCLSFCVENHLPFRIRSGGHQHEGMSSGDGVLILDLSGLYRNTETNVVEIEYSNDGQQAWIPSGMKLDRVYTELRARGKIIPGGGCQSVNVGGLTQGGGWGVHLRKYGLTCDQLLDAEVVLADGSFGRASEFPNGDRLLWALRGGGGGNFGVVTRYKFNLCDLNHEMTTFGIFWKKDVEAKKGVKTWVDLHLKNDFTENLSFTANFTRVNEQDHFDQRYPERDLTPFSVRGRIGGNFYGDQASLIKFLKEHFGDLIPLDNDGEPITDRSRNSYFSSIRTSEIKAARNILSSGEQPTEVLPVETPGSVSLDTDEYTLCQLNVVLGTEDAPTSAYLQSTPPEPKFRFDVLPDAPRSTCDQPHPHKVTSVYPADGIEDAQHMAMVDWIFERLKATPYRKDVNRYMVWPCLGGAMRRQEFKEVSSFAFRDKPYLFQLQSWWDHAGQLRNDPKRDDLYVKWMNDFRQDFTAGHPTEGAFINFVDKDIPVDERQSPEDQKLELLKHYYGENLERLQEIKSMYDKDNVFDFEMSIPVR